MAAATHSDTDTQPLVVDCEWFDAQTTLHKPLRLFFYPHDDTIELHDVKLRRLFLKRSARPDTFHVGLLRVGTAVNIFGRQLNITAYGDEYTRHRLCSVLQSALVAVPVDGVADLFARLGQRHFQLRRLRMAAPSALSQVFSTFPISSKSPGALSVPAQGKVVLAEVTRDDALTELAQQCAECVAVFAQTPSNDEEADRRLDLVFNGAKQISRTATTGGSSTLAIIKPHVMAADDHMARVGYIVQRILGAGFRIEDAQLVKMDRDHTAEFLEIYKTVVPEYHAMVDELVSGPCLAMEISGGPDPPAELLAEQGASNNPTVTAFRLLCGPSDPALARQVRPDGLRARFGESRVQNGLHCTDLADDGQLEVDYFFRILGQ